MNDTISRQAAIDALTKNKEMINAALDSLMLDYNSRIIQQQRRGQINEDIETIEKLPSAQPTLCGYDIEHLILIANVLRKENLPPERIVEALTDIGRIVSIVTDEFKESLRKTVEQCKI